LNKETKKAVKSCLKNSTSLSETAVLDIARRRVGQFLPLEADGYACTTEQLVDVLLAVSAQKETIEQVCADLQIKVGAETIGGYFNAQLKVENLFELQEAVNLALQTSVNSDLKRQKLEVAIDFHDQSYYGRSEQTEGLWVGAEAKNGTTKVYRVATLYVIKNGYRLTLAIKFVLPPDSAKEIVEYLLQQLSKLEIEAKCLYLDRGFGAIEIVRYLKEIKQTAIVACPSARENRRSQSVVCGTKKLSHKARFQECETRRRRNGNDVVQGIYNDHEKRSESAKSKMVGIHVGWL
jgi:hypothetical protein